VNKIVQSDYYKNRDDSIYKNALQFSKMDSANLRRYFTTVYSDFDFAAVKRTNCSSKIPSVHPAPSIDETPSFRSFAMAVAESLLSCRGRQGCRASVDVHFKPQFDRCLPCLLKYDAVIKVREVTR